MRVPIAAFALVLRAAAALTQDFQIVELTTYSGNLPCADCVGIQYVLSLRPDGRFYRQRSYLHSENSGQIVLDIGAWTAAWSASGPVVTLATTMQERETFAVSADKSLLLMDRDGNRSACAGQSELNCALTRAPQAYVPMGSYRIRGIYREAGARRTLQPCGSPSPLPAETSGRQLLLQRLSSAVAGGKPALITVTGVLEKATSAQSGETLRIANVLTAQPGGACPASAPLPAVVADLKPPSATTAKPPTDISALLLQTSWVLTEIDHLSPPAGVGEGEASISFVQEGRVSGFTGCNRFNGPFTLTGRSVHFGPIVTTRMACPVSANIETPYMKVLDDARRIDVQGQELYLLNEAGRRLARFRAVKKP
jgi:heat shock protein HslJ